MRVDTFRAESPLPGREWLCTITHPKDSSILSFVHGATREQAEGKAAIYVQNYGKPKVLKQKLAEFVASSTTPDFEIEEAF